MINIVCNRHPAEILPVTEGGFSEQRGASIFVGQCPRCRQEAKDSAYTTGVDDGKFELQPLLTAYRSARAVDGLNGRPWDAMKHGDAEMKLAELGEPETHWHQRCRELAALPPCGNRMTDPLECDNTATAEADGGLAVCPNAKDGTCQHFKGLLAKRDADKPPAETCTFCHDAGRLGDDIPCPYCCDAKKD